MADVADMRSRVDALLSSVGLPSSFVPDEDLARFCKNANNLSIVSYVDAGGVESGVRSNFHYTASCVTLGNWDDGLTQHRVPVSFSCFSGPCTSCRTLADETNASTANKDSILTDIFSAQVCVTLLLVMDGLFFFQRLTLCGPPPLLRQVAEMAPAVWYLSLRAVDRFHATHGRFPGVDDATVRVNSAVVRGSVGVAPELCVLVGPFFPYLDVRLRVYVAACMCVCLSVVRAFHWDCRCRVGPVMFWQPAGARQRAVGPTCVLPLLRARTGRPSHFMQTCSRDVRDVLLGPG